MDNHYYSINGQENHLSMITIALYVGEGDPVLCLLHNIEEKHNQLRNCQDILEMLW